MASDKTVAESVGMQVSFATAGEVVVNAVEYARLKAELAALQWTPITPDNLPKMGDEVRRPHNSKAVQKHNNPEILAVTEFMITLFSWQNDHAELWHEQSWTHFRPIAPPVQASATEAEEQQAREATRA